MVKRLSEFKDIHKGKKVIVCGCGVSLNIMKDYHQNFITIGVNDVPKLFTPTYLVVTDHPQRFSLPRRALVMQSQSKALFTCVKGWRNANTVMFDLGSRKLASLDHLENVDHFMNSPYVATGIAYKMGFTNIGLIGVDFTKNHFYAKDGHHPLSSMKKIRHVSDAYGVMKTELKNRGVNFYNLSKDSSITSIPKMDIEEFKKL
jgi:hypothetical protein